MRCVNAEPQPVAPPPHAPQAAPAPGRAPRRLWLPAGVLTAVGGAFAYVAAVDPNEPGHYPVCPLWRFTGLYCPGCGGLRSAHAFAHGDLATALTDNALAVAGFVGFAVLWTAWVVRVARGRPVRLELGTVQLWTLGVLVFAFTVVRNLPFGGWLHP
ncbi:DUF2752 domain-containing protein [Streptomyces ipomoeae]|uniref:DUF2752 domain-containing protein n=1 Tax=Streptomyces ipomoeae TaxID=103232 RepID=UPI000997ED44|nr:DUF2752 domain-containing protein [Streptomyces ipomoeae]MDX2693073.1 DUF2752 domain-containing protein [Streptomyces ipomoeae]MDX2821096.1 DUF2752 domain-containing protein [Streptomyces ipomoeae]MDX2838451.1 DUF2752 domain-containing protein [Streptomyces ipomoeae]MDX2875042.1 DUF2752 domain-containing protein [Streptomyces ipomoeae]TQE23191.1 DUF2752 domain-containing protein [Streptomyces ipomoeae]